MDEGKRVDERKEEKTVDKMKSVNERKRGDERDYG